MLPSTPKNWNYASQPDQYHSSNIRTSLSLAVAIGYPDLVSVFAGTTLSQTGQAIEIIAITLSIYLALSVAVSLFMNWYNARHRLVVR